MHNEDLELFPRPVELGLGALVFVSVGMYFLEIDLAKTDASIGFWLACERVVALVFTLEYVCRWRTCGHRYPVTTVGVIDLLAILPFWIGFLVPHSWLGLVRTLRVLRLLKLYRYSTGMRAFVGGLQRARGRLTGMGLVVMILVLFSSVGIYEIEKDNQPETFGSLANTLWWTVVTLLSVGYGDAVPISPLGKTFATFVMLLGTGIMAAFIGIVGASVFNEMTRQDRAAARRLADQSGEGG